MSVKLEIPQIIKDNERTIPKVFLQDNQEVRTDSNIDIRSILAIALHDPDESLKFHPRYNWCLYQPTNEKNK